MEVGWIDPRLRNQTQWSEHAGEKSGFLSWFTMSVHGDLNGLVVRGHLAGLRLDGDGHREGLSTTRSADKSEITELCDLVFHYGRVVPNFAAVVIIVTSLHRHNCTIVHLLKWISFS